MGISICFSDFSQHVSYVLDVPLENVQIKRSSHRDIRSPLPKPLVIKQGLARKACVWGRDTLGS